ncbi:MAG: cell wall hydrolase [Candidatus Contendobacter sp.]|nr:cell wall hydrolase [Candidatus Contendobacter sp.]MDG4557461.1 cell wall hydrolase [Candidatus Contendobacter sp.]
MAWPSSFGWLAAGLLWTGTAVAADLPACLTRAADETTRSAVMKISPADEELLARLAYAEGRSTGFADDPRVYRGIAWGVMNRVRLSETSAVARRQYGDGVAGVIFQPKQFNPAVSLRSPFSNDFLCPQDPTRWRLAVDAAHAALRGRDNPFIQTPWERQSGRSLVVNFYYPQSSQALGPLAPWEDSRTLRFIGDPDPGGSLPPAERIRFYRLAQPPGDLRDPAPP